METFWLNIVNFFNNTGWKILLTLCLIVIGGVIIKYLAKGIQRLLYKTSIDNSVVSFVISIFKIILWVLLIFVCASILELSTSSLIVCLSSVALAIGLALKDSLGNLTNGLFIIYNKPFKRGDHIRIDEVEGKVQNIKLLSTELVAFDNRKLIIPNSKFTTDTIVNYTALPTRRIELVFSVAYGSDMDYVEKVIYKTLENQPLILSYPKSSIFISEHAASSVDWTIWAWVATEDYWTVWKALPRIIYEALDKAEIQIPFDQLDVHFNDVNVTKPKQIVKAIPKTDINKIVPKAVINVDTNSVATEKNTTKKPEKSNEVVNVKAQKIKTTETKKDTSKPTKVKMIKGVKNAK